jgi:hypothetical protein
MKNVIDLFVKITSFCTRSPNALEFEDLCLVDLFNLNLHVYRDKPEIIKSSKNVNAVLYQGFYYNHFRSKKNSVQD